MAEVIRCSQCGAVAGRLDARFCDFCGTELPRLESEAAAPAPTPFVDTEARFRMLAEHVDYAELMRVEAKEPAAGLLNLFVLIGVVVVTGLTLAIASAAFFAPAAIFFLVLAAALIALLVSSNARTRAYARSPLQRFPALVVDERTKVQGEGSSASRTGYFTTLQLQDGERREFRTRESVFAELTGGDIGVAYVKAGLLIDFGRVSI